MVDVIHSPLSPALALAALEQYVRESSAVILPTALRARGVVKLVLASTPDGSRLQLNRARRHSMECIGHIAGTSSGSILTYEIVERPSRRVGTVWLGMIWLGVLLYLRLPVRQTVSLLTLAAIVLTLSAFGTPTGSALRVGVYEIFTSALQGSDLHAAP
jgi:hypothetical protein